MLRLLLAVAVSAALLVGGTAVATAGPGKQKPRAGAALAVKTGKGGHVQAAAQYLGLTRAQLVAELRQGKSLAQVATATPGRTVAGLKAALLTAHNAKIDAALAAGRIDAARADAASRFCCARIDALVERSFTPRG